MNLNARQISQLFVITENGTWYSLQGITPSGAYGTDWCVMRGLSGPDCLQQAPSAVTGRLPVSGFADAQVLKESAARAAFAALDTPVVVPQHTPAKQRWTCFEPFTFTDGVRSAWVTYEGDPNGERRCVAVSEILPPPHIILRPCDTFIINDHNARVSLRAHVMVWAGPAAGSTILISRFFERWGEAAAFVEGYRAALASLKVEPTLDLAGEWDNNTGEWERKE